MSWIGILEIGGVIITVLLLILIFRELKKSIKESNEGKQSDKCDLD
jgi:hypothetical protein